MVARQHMQNHVKIMALTGTFLFSSTFAKIEGMPPSLAKDMIIREVADTTAVPAVEKLTTGKKIVMPMVDAWSPPETLYISWTNGLIVPTGPDSTPPMSVIQNMSAMTQGKVNSPDMATDPHTSMSLATVNPKENALVLVLGRSRDAFFISSAICVELSQPTKPRAAANRPIDHAAYNC
jgi:hypothetical protein